MIAIKRMNRGEAEGGRKNRTAQETEKKSLRTDQEKQGKTSEEATGAMTGGLLKETVGETVTRRKRQAEPQGGLRALTVGAKTLHT